MERNTIEKQLKEQLQKREIVPSKNAWNRISKELEAPHEPSSKRFYWYGVAAGLIGILFISVLYYVMVNISADTEIQISNVENDVDTEAKSIFKINGNKGFEEQNISKGDTDENEFIVDTKVTDEIPNQNKNEKKSIQNDVLAVTDEVNNEIDEITPANTSEALIDAKIAEVAAQVAVLEHNHSAATDAEIDSLLRAAQREILADKIFIKNKSVDAMALLADVENELDQSFRDQVFDALKNGFYKVRTAVADRNK